MGAPWINYRIGQARQAQLVSENADLRARLQPRHLTDQDQSAIAYRLAGYYGGDVRIESQQDPGAAKFAIQLAQAIQSGGWKIDGGSVQVNDIVGFVTPLVINANDNSAELQVLLNALNDGHVIPDAIVTPAPGSHPNAIVIEVGPNPLPSGL
jgi:hypothetical protein